MDFLFDIGRVLLDFDFESSLARLLPEEKNRRSLGKLLSRKDEFETGRIGPDEYIRRALEELGCDAGPDEFRHRWREIFIPNEPMWRCVRQLAADGHRLILFSNTNALHCPWIFQQYPEFSLFHGAVLSYEVGSIKPDPGIYQHAIAIHGLEPSSTFYIDDLPENIATGERFGFHSHLYDLRDHGSFEQWLARSGICLP